MRDDDGFIIRHYAGSVCYQTALFLEKNNDALHASLEFLMEQSEYAFWIFFFVIFFLFRNVYTKKLFGQPENGNGVPAANGKSQHQKLSVASVSSKFRSQLGLLLHKLENTVQNLSVHADMKADLRVRTSCAALSRTRTWLLDSSKELRF